MANIAAIFLAATALFVSTATGYASAADPVFATAIPPAAIPLFSNQPTGAMPKDWAFQPVRNAPHPTKYALVRDDELGVTVLEGSANAAAGALIYRFDDDARINSILRFKWKAGGLIASSDPRTKGGDDYVARIYVTFAVDPERASVKEKAENAVAHVLYGETPPHAALSYVFTHKAAVGAIITSPYTRRVKKIVVDADPASVGKWKSFTRDIYDDYKRAFGEEPTRISGVAIMVDTDNTGETTSARFGDISLSSRP
jgi:Protein of unknown function (DUF3047)